MASPLLDWKSAGSCSSSGVGEINGGSVGAVVSSGAVVSGTVVSGTVVSGTVDSVITGSVGAVVSGTVGAVVSSEAVGSGTVVSGIVGSSVGSVGDGDSDGRGSVSCGAVAGTPSGSVPAAMAAVGSSPAVMTRAITSASIRKCFFFIAFLLSENLIYIKIPYHLAGDRGHKKSPIQKNRAFMERKEYFVFEALLMGILCHYITASRAGPFIRSRDINHPVRSIFIAMLDESVLHFLKMV